eukprot:TRINITY_DN4450_c0_g2_i2.p2 TRINITY_DN4450_c0_g2~~TRINITY_DN4450_c0_g2_i2.p2  ORF type:complete len:123 (+),score=12.40 TRINITY_DN4450_c0_g2_i2:24-392(+)
MSSGQTLGVKAQRFRGHTSPHRNVKEKKKKKQEIWLIFQVTNNSNPAIYIHNFLIHEVLSQRCQNKFVILRQELAQYKKTKQIEHLTKTSEKMQITSSTKLIEFLQKILYLQAYTQLYSKQK